MRAGHTGEKRFACSHEGCVHAFAQSGELKKHSLLHTGGKPFVCCWEDCGRAFTQSGPLKSHLRLHTGEKPFVCPREGCGYASATSGSLTRHLRFHSGEKPFVCPREGCGQAFKQSGDLIAHRRTHSGERPFVCSWEGCGRSFVQLNHLKKHRYLHLPAKPFVCPWEGCRSSFVQPSFLKKHWHRHAGNNAFVCSHEDCGHSFAQASALQGHLRTVHPIEKPFVCPGDGCGQLFARSAALTRHLRLCTRAGSLECLQADPATRSVASRTSCRPRLARRQNPRLFQCAEAGKQRPVKKQYRSSFAAATAPDVPVDPGPAPGLEHQGTGVSSDSPRSSATVSPGVSAPFDRSLAPADREEQRSPGLNLLPWPPSPIAQLEWTQSSSAMASLIPDWSACCADEHLYGDWLSLFSASASDLEAPPLLLTDDDKAFWQTLISPADSEVRHSAY